MRWRRGCLTSVGFDGSPHQCFFQHKGHEGHKEYKGYKGHKGSIVPGSEVNDTSAPGIPNVEPGSHYCVGPRRAGPVGVTGSIHSPLTRITSVPAGVLPTLPSTRNPTSAPESTTGEGSRFIFVCAAANAPTAIKEATQNTTSTRRERMDMIFLRRLAEWILSPAKGVIAAHLEA